MATRTGLAVTTLAILLQFWDVQTFEVKKVAGQTKVKLDVYSESLCPDTNRFFTSQLGPVWQELHDSIDVTVVPFGNANFYPTTGGGWRFECQHGPRECVVNTYQCCGIDRLAEDPVRYMPLVLCAQGKKIEQTAECSRAAGLDHTAMLACTNGTDGQQLEHAAAVKTKAQQPAINWIPWVMIDGARDEAAEYNLKSAICKKLQSYGGELPPPCRS